MPPWRHECHPFDEKELYRLTDWLLESHHSKAAEIAELQRGIPVWCDL